ncbi:MAG: hypothetical protein DRP41_07530 [Thermodesulfobacteriota bacterium]|nr:MAG: hypothetical protein DRP41_07530 [Thermodesulfobacteriota bacterium]
MSQNKTSISKKSSYQEIGEFWNTHDLSEFWDQIKPAKFEVDIQTQRIYYPLDSELSDYILKLARKRRISPETLINLWISEKIRQEKETA